MPFHFKIFWIALTANIALGLLTGATIWTGLQGYETRFAMVFEMLFAAALWHIIITVSAEPPQEKGFGKSLFAGGILLGLMLLIQPLLLILAAKVLNIPA